MSKIEAAVLTACALLVSITPAAARPGGWGGSGWGNSGWSGGGRSPIDSRFPDRNRYDDGREGRVEASHFVVEGDAAAALGHGPVRIVSESGEQDYMAGPDRAVYEAAVIDQLVKAGYDTTQAAPEGGQVAELRIVRDVLVPAEAKRNPVSGTAAMEVGTRGSTYGLAVAVDMTKPRTALVSTRMEARILDQATGKVLWEGRAEIATRDGDDKWNGNAIASKLTEAMFDNFPRPERNGRPVG